MAGATGISGALLLVVVVSPLSLIPWAALGFIAVSSPRASPAPGTNEKKITISRRDRSHAAGEFFLALGRRL
jgi:hypothetical protein